MPNFFKTDLGKATPTKSSKFSLGKVAGLGSSAVEFSILYDMKKKFSLI